MNNKNIGDIVYVCVSGIPTECKLSAIDITPGIHLLQCADGRTIIADDTEFFETSNSCLMASIEKRKQEYANAALKYSSLNHIVAHLIYSIVNKRELTGVELNAVIDKSTELLGSDICVDIESVAKEYDVPEDTCA